MRHLVFLLMPFARAALDVLDSECSNIDTSAYTILNPNDVRFLADDILGGRVEKTEGSILAQEFLIDNMLSIGAVGLNSSTTGRDAFRLDVNHGQGTSILGLLEGHTDEYIYLSAHYDHLEFCSVKPNADSTVCNGAMDNAASVAIVLGVGRFLAAHPEKRRHNIVLAFWDLEEQGHSDGSNYYANHNPLVPLGKTITILNWDIQGANLAPSVRDTTLAIGADTGGPRLKRAVRRAVENAGTDLDVKHLSQILGEDRSDHANFSTKGVPVVFFTDATNGCYHSDGDEVKRVDFDKLEKQAKVAAALAYDLSCRKRTPHLAQFRLAHYRDAWQLFDLFDRIVKNDLEYWDAENGEQLTSTRNRLRRIKRRGPLLFPLATLSFLRSVQKAVYALAEGECHGFQAGGEA